MCGRYSNAKDLSELIKLVDSVMRVAFFGPRYNIAPTQMAPVIFLENKKPTMKLMRWGLIPSWAKDETTGNALVNARAETLNTRQAFDRRFSNGVVWFRLMDFTSGRNGRENVSHFGSCSKMANLFVLQGCGNGGLSLHRQDSRTPIWRKHRPARPSNPSPSSRHRRMKRLRRCINECQSSCNRRIIVGGWKTKPAANCFNQR